MATDELDVSIALFFQGPFEFEEDIAIGGEVWLVGTIPPEVPPRLPPRGRCDPPPPTEA